MMRFAILLIVLMFIPSMFLFQDLDKKLNTLVLQSPAVSEETEKCKRYGCLEIVVLMLSIVFGVLISLCFLLYTTY